MAEYNENAYRMARKAFIEYGCPFERALLSRCVRCGRSRTLNLAEREAIACDDPAVRELCLVFYDALHENAQFALKIVPAASRPLANPEGGARQPTQAAVQSPQAAAATNTPVKPASAPWPFGKEIRAQCGGVRGLAAAMDTVGDETTDIAATVLQGHVQYGGCSEFPYSEIMRAVVHFEPRKRRS